MLKHIIFTEEPATTYSIAILIKETCLKYKEMQYNYVLPLSGKMPNENVIAFSLEYTDKNTSPAVFSRKYLIDTLLPAVAHLEIKTLFCCDASYFKYLTGAKKAETSLGYVLPCVIKGYEHLNIVLGINYSSMLYNDLNVPKLALALTTLVDHLEGTLVNLGADIIHSALYPTTLAQVKAMLAEKLNEPHISVDIEAFSLKFHKAGIGTICFCKDKHNGISFLVDYRPITPKLIDGKWHHGEQWDNQEFKKELALFFIKYTGKVTYHNANYDVKVLIYELFMDNLLDQAGMLNGLEIMTRGLQDTKVIKYLATNTTAGNKLGLKESIHEFTGDYAEEVNDIRLISSKSLLKYNLIDGLGTHYLYEKCWDTLVKDDQLSIYTDIFIPSIKVILQMELTGMPVCMETILKTKAMMLAKQTKYKDIVQAHPIIIKFTELVKHKKMIKENAKLVKKQHDISHYADLHFNPNSNNQMQHLLYEYLDYPVIDKTKSKAPAVGADTVRKFFVMDGIASAEEISLLKAILDYLDVSKILTTFIESFISNSILKEDGWYYLHGNFNLGGTVSGRLSSSQPNMQNIPSTGSTYAKDIKRCFKAPPGWLFVGADFALIIMAHLYSNILD